MASGSACVLSSFFAPFFARFAFGSATSPDELDDELLLLLPPPPAAACDSQAAPATSFERFFAPPFFSDFGIFMSFLSPAVPALFMSFLSSVEIGWCWSPPREPVRVGIFVGDFSVNCGILATLSWNRFRG